MTPSAGELWLADRGDETRRLVLVVSDERFHRFAERVMVAPLLDSAPAVPRPWHVAVGDHTVAVNQLGTMPVERLLERVDLVPHHVLLTVRRAVRHILG